MTNRTYHNYEKQNALSFILAMRIEDLLEELEVVLQRMGNKLVGPCPIHGGKNYSSFNLYPEGEDVPGFWKCRSHKCHNTFKPTILGFIRGVLSHQKGWESPGDEVISFPNTLNWACDFVGQNLNDIKIDEKEVEKRRFVSQTKRFCRESTKQEGVCRSLVQKSLRIPSPYFLERNFSKEILCKYDVGECLAEGKEMFGRVVVPVYDDSKNFMIGCTGRSLFERCKECGSYHSPKQNCPQNEIRWLHSKWKNSKNFETSSYLYNYWNAKEYIDKSSVAIIVEGPADCWRLEQCGIRNSVALFGSELTDQQSILLESSGAMSVILLLDNDEAGRIATEEIGRTLKRSYNVHTPSCLTNVKRKDVGEMTCEEVKQLIIPYVKGVEKKYGF